MGFIGEFISVDPSLLKREKAKARQLRQSQWWKNLRGQGVCYYCKKPTAPLELTMDHKIPLSRGGKSTKGNLVAACKDCNNQKKYLLLVEWSASKEAK